MHRKSRKHKIKIGIGIGAVVMLTTVSVAITGLIIQANNAMSGVEQAIAERENYRILEVVSQKEEGNMGFLAEGQEPCYLTDRLDLWLAEQQQNPEFVNSKANREAYVAELYEKLISKTADITQGESAARYPLSYLPYQESYTQVEGYQELVFPEGMVEEVTAKAQFAPYDQLTPEQQAFGKYVAVLSDTGEIIDYEEAGEEEAGEETEPESETEIGSEIEPESETETEAVYYGIASYSFGADDAGYDVIVTVDRVYYTGGFSNNNWFKTYVLGLEQNSALTVEVATLLPQELEEQYQQNDMEYFNQFDMIVVGTDLSEEMSGLLNEVTAETDKPLLVEKSLSEPFLGYVTEGIYLSNNIFFYDEASLGENFLEPLGAEAGESFTSVYERLEAEKIINSKQLDVTPAVVMQYLIQLNGMKVNGLMNIKDRVKILEIQPNHSFDLMLTGDDVTTSAESGAELMTAHSLYLTETGVEKLDRLKQLLVKVGTIDETADHSQLYTLAQRITGVSASEFNSKEINVGQEYDLIYIGANTEAMNLDSEGNTLYNDASLNGLVYHATGDSNSMQAASKNRYGGNDISEESMQHLLDAVTDHCPVIIEEKLFDGTNVNTAAVEAGSQMAMWMDTIKELPNVYTFTEFLESSSSPVYTNLRRPEFRVADIWTEGGVEMLFSIEIPGIPTTETYPLKLFADRDGDGSYHQAEQVTSFMLVDMNGEAVEQTADGAYLLMAGKNYQVSWQAEKVGSTRLPYRFVCQLGEQVSVWEEGVCTTDKTGGSEKIKILQIKKESDALEMQYNRVFQLLCETKQMDSYRIMTKTLTTAEFAEQFEAGASIGQNLLEQYDVLVLSGFDLTDAAASDNLLGYGPFEAICRYAQQGHSVLLLGDVQDDEIYQTLTGMTEPSDFVLNQSKEEGSYYSLSEETGIGVCAPQGRAVAENMRDGVVSAYPFSVSGSLELTQLVYPKIALDTKQQGYVVWYGMSDLLDENGSSVANAYRADYGNMRNNYLLYSYDNIMYYGITWADLNMDVTMDAINDADSYKEWKLFVNALIACYNAGVKNPDVSILQGNTLSSGNKEVEYILMDQQLELEDSIDMGLTQQNMTLNFALEDYNISDGNKSISVRYYVADKNGTDTIAGNIPVRKLGTDGHLTTQLVVDGVAQGEDVSNSLKSGNVYQVTIPGVYSEVTENGYADIYVVISSTMTRDGEMVHASGYTMMTLTKVQLFNLD